MKKITSFLVLLAYAFYSYSEQNNDITYILSQLRRRPARKTQFERFDDDFGFAPKTSKPGRKKH